MVRLALFIATLGLTLNSYAETVCSQLDRSMPAYQLTIDDQFEIATLTVSGRGMGTATHELYCHLVPSGSAENSDLVICDTLELTYRAILRDATTVDLYEGVNKVKSLKCD